MSPTDDTDLDKPITRWHNLSNAVNATSLTTAVMMEVQKTLARQGDRIEAGVGSISGRVEQLAIRAAQLETDLAVKTGQLHAKIEAMEERFAPTRNAVNGLIALIVTAVVLAIIAVVMKR